MKTLLFRRILPLLLLGGLTLSSCVVHEHSYGRRPDYRHDHHRDYGYRHGRY